MDRMDTTVECQGLVKRFGGPPVVDHLDLAVGRGRVLALLGPNGSGKTTTIRLLLGLARADEGAARVLGRPYVDLDRPFTRVRALLDTPATAPGHSGRTHLRLAARAAGVPWSAVDETLEMVGLAGAAALRVSRYSLGMRQRLALATALLGRPEVLVLDEPVNGLDPAGIVWLRGVLRERARSGATVLVSSHLLAETSAMADEVVLLDAGRVVAAGSVADLTSSGSLESFYMSVLGDRGDAQRVAASTRKAAP